jgi:hypothetical protein
MKSPSIKQLAKSVGAAENTLYRWQREEGVDIRNPDALRLRANMMRDREQILPPASFGRLLRERLEAMPCAVIDEIDAATDRRGKIAPLCHWVAAALRELVMHPDCPDGLPLTDAERVALAEYLAEQQAG